jgi:glyoxylase-like metal-dependent hydrolase (beta-lactamase superfamily II)
MIEINNIGEITQIRLASEHNGEPYYWVSAYLVDGLLIDTGCSKALPEFSNFLRKAKIDLVVNTHSHQDHIGANSLIQKELRLPVYAGKLAIPLIEDPPKTPWYLNQVWGPAEPSNPLPLPDVVETARFRFDVFDTPGHSPDHVCLVERNRRWVFSGDLYVGRELSVAGPETNVSDMLESINSLISVMDDETIMFTALRTVRFDGRKTLMDFARHFEGLREHARKLASQGMSVPEIVNRLFGSESVFDSITDGLFSSANLVRAFLGD